MKTKTTVVLAMMLSMSWARGQGTINFGNSFSGIFRAPIYLPNPVDPCVSQTGQSALGLPTGTTVYGGALIQGTGYTMGLYAGPAGTVDANLLTLVTTTTFRTSTANSLPAGLVTTITNVVIPGIPAGSQATLQIRVWENLTDFTNALWRGTSALFDSDLLGGTGPTGPITSPNTVGWASFSVYSAACPEPTVIALGAIGVAMLWMLRGVKDNKRT
jgi:hypothetical protein